MQRYNARHQQQNRQQQQAESLEHDEQQQRQQQKQKTPELFSTTTSSSSDDVVVTEWTPLKDDTSSINLNNRHYNSSSNKEDNNSGSSNAKKALEITNNNNKNGTKNENENGSGNGTKKKDSNNNSTTRSTLSQKAKEEWDRLSEHVLSGAVLLRSSIVAGGRNFGHPLLPQAEIADLERQQDEEDPTNPNRLDPQMHSTERRRKLSRDQKREEYQEAIRNSMDFSLGQCLLAIAVYVGVAVIAYSYVFERWTVVDSMYFAVITFTTIGYGDLAPTTVAGKVFTAFFALSGVACLGIALGELGSNLIEAEQTAMRQARKMSEKSALTLFVNNNDNDENDNNNNTREQEQQAETPPHNNDGEHEQQQHPEHPQHHHHHHGEQYMPPPQQPHAMTHSAIVTGLRETGVVVLIVAIFAFIMNVDPNLDFGWDLGTTLYFAIITSCTVGYGDIAPTSQVGRFVAVLLIPAAVGAMGHWLSVVAGAIIDRRQAKFRELWKAHQLTQEDLEVMDHDGDGNVTRAEFLEFMLVATDVVDQETVDELRAVFEGLDADGTGSLSREDLIVNAKRKCASPERKLEMARYKQQLLEQAESARKERRQRRSSSSSARGLLQGSIFGSMMSIGSNLSGGTSSTRNLSGGSSARNLRRFSSSRGGASQTNNNVS